ncbi:MAG: FIST C-terminal domain-containing protein [Betaproteobacteria bacterium]
MTLATALITGNEPHPQLVEDAVHQALAKAGLTQANSVLLFLTSEFSRHAQAAVTAAARVAQCTQVAGGIASGVLTETGWALDRPAAAVMVLGGELTLGFPAGEHCPVLSYAGGVFPAEWDDTATRFGSTFSGTFAGSSAHAHPAVWHQSRLSEQQRLSVKFNEAELAIGVSSGLQWLGKAQPIESCTGYDVETIAGQSAEKSLRDALPEEFRQQPLPLHLFSAVIMDSENSAIDATDSGSRSTPIIAINADHSLTLAERVQPGQFLIWVIRQPDSAENEMRQCVDRLAESIPAPDAALMFSCIGRGPYFYAGEDRDLNVLRQRFPGLPILGTYGTGQIAPANPRSGEANRQLENAVVTALIRRQT